MILKGKNAVIFAAGGAIGSAVARRFVEEGAQVILSGRTTASLSALAKELNAESEIVDATDESAVAAHLARAKKRVGDLHIVINAIGVRVGEADYATNSTTIPFEKFMRPIATIAGSQFLTARCAARHMLLKGEGSIVLLSASLSGIFVPFMSGITSACGAVEAMTRTLAAEFGPAGIRVNCIRAGGMPETRTIQETTAMMAKTMGALSRPMSRPTSPNVLSRPLRVDEAAAIIAFIASDRASGIAGQVLNVCAGAVVSH